MKRLTFVQGSAEWHAHRATARNASEAPAVLGCSLYMPRSELLHVRHTGLRREHTAAEERRFADGHSIEAAQRPGAESIIGEPLYPVTGSEVVDGIELSASFDGITMDEEIAYECKTLNDDLRAVLLYESDAANEGRGRNLPKHYRAQMEQQLMVCGGERVLFVAATKDGSDVRRCWYFPDPALRAEILAAWRQFDEDLAAYQPTAKSPAAAVVAAPVQALPAVAVQVAGEIAIRHNFDAFEVALRDFLEHRLIRQPKTDQDFADLDVQIKAMKGAEAALESAEQNWIAQIEAVGSAKRTKDMLAKLVRDNRLMAEKLLASEKERRKGEIVSNGQKALQAHIDALHVRLGKPYLPAIPADFAGAVRGLKSLASMEDKVATVLANAKIAANDAFVRVQANLEALRDLAADYRFLFNDAAALVLKAPDDCRAVITARIAEHKAEQERRAAELAEKERARIRQEEEAKARAQAQVEQQEREAAERRQREQLEAAARQADKAAKAAQLPAAAAPIAAPVASSPAAAPTPGANVVPMQRPAAAPASAAPKAPASVSITALNEALGLNVTANLLEKVGFPAATVQGKAGKFYSPDDLPAICRAMASHLNQRAEFFEQQKAA